MPLDLAMHQGPTRSHLSHTLPHTGPRALRRMVPLLRRMPLRRMPLGRMLLGLLALLAVLPTAGGAQVTGTLSTGGIMVYSTGAAVQTLTLDDALSLALQANRELQRAQATLEEAEGMVREAWGGVYPRVEFSSFYTRNLSPAVSFLPAQIFDPEAAEGELVRVQFGSDNIWGTSITLEQPIFQAQAFIGVGAAGRFKAFQDEAVRGVVHQVVTRVRLQYYELLLAEEQSRLIQRSLERVVQSLEETRALNRAGLASDYDVLRLEVEFANLEPQLRRAINEARRMEREMATVLDLPPGTTIGVSGSLAGLDLENPGANTPENRRLLALQGVDLPVQLTEATLTALLDRAQGSNSQLQQAGLNAELRNTELHLALAEFAPRVTLFGSYDIQAQQDGRPNFFGESNQRGYGRNVGIRVSVPIFTGFQRMARVDQRQATVRAARIEEEMAGNQLRDQLVTLLEQVDEARLRVRSQGLAVEQARRGFDIASAQYREGLGSQLELTDAEVALRQSEFNYAGAAYEYLSARARLDQVVGEVPLPGRGL